MVGRLVHLVSSLVCRLLLVLVLMLMLVLILRLRLVLMLVLKLVLMLVLMPVLMPVLLLPQLLLVLVPRGGPLADQNEEFWRALVGLHKTMTLTTAMMQTTLMTLAMVTVGEVKKVVVVTVAAAAMEVVASASVNSSPPRPSSETKRNKRLTLRTQALAGGFAEPQDERRDGNVLCRTTNSSSSGAGGAPGAAATTREGRVDNYHAGVLDLRSSLLQGSFFSWGTFLAVFIDRFIRRWRRADVEASTTVSQPSLAHPQTSTGSSNDIAIACLAHD